MKDEQILSQILVGDMGAFREFYKQTKPKLRVMLRKRVGTKEDIEEVLQDTYLAFLDSLPLFQGKSTLETFLWSIARHEVADYWRKRYAKKAIRTVPFVDQVYTEKLFSAAETNEEIGRVYGRLKSGEARILKMKYEKGMSIKEIAGDLKISVKAAESKLFRARKSFQLAYGEIS